MSLSPKNAHVAVSILGVKGHLFGYANLYTSQKALDKKHLVEYEELKIASLELNQGFIGGGGGGGGTGLEGGGTPHIIIRNYIE